jgi:hypothetical protein
MQIEVLPPNINESLKNFTVVPDKNQIRFGLIAVKNVGEGIIEATTSERKTNGPFLSISDFNMILKRISHRFLVEFKKNWYDVNKNMIETDENYKDMYINYYQNILGGDQSEDIRSHKIRTWLYNRIKSNIQHYTII